MPQATDRTKADLVELTREWVAAEAGRIPGFYGAFLHGSILEKEDGALIPVSSDVDVIVVLDHANPPAKPGKLAFEGALLDVTYLPLDHVRTPGRILANYHLAPSFAKIDILADPGGGLVGLHRAVAREYAAPEWVERRMRHARKNVLEKLSTLQSPAPFHDHVMAWLFAAGILCHVFLVAGLKNPTVRRRYTEARALLLAHGREDVYENLLELLGCSRLDPSCTARHLERMTSAFDDAKSVVRTAFPFASDISDLARPISVDGSREMIERGDHREAVFWIAATYCRCLKIFATDAPKELYEAHWQGFAELIADLGIESPEGIKRSAADVEAALPGVVDVARSLRKAPSP